MSEIISTEIKSDLENIYKITGDISNLLEAKDFTEESDEIRELMNLIKFRLEDICGTLQKDIYNCDYLLTKYITATINHSGGNING
jgi:hypothetical protein